MMERVYRKVNDGKGVLASNDGKGVSKVNDGNGVLHHSEFWMLPKRNT